MSPERAHWKICKGTIQVVLPLLLVSCADCTTDPAQAGFFCGVRNLTTGTYTARQQAMQMQAQQAETQAQLRRQKANLLQGEAQSLGAEKLSLQQALARLQTDLNRESEQLAQARARRDADQQKLSDLQRELSALQERKRSLMQSGQVTEEEILGLRQGVRNLTQNVDRVLKLYKAE